MSDDRAGFFVGGLIGAALLVMFAQYVGASANTWPKVGCLGFFVGMAGTAILVFGAESFARWRRRHF